MFAAVRRAAEETRASAELARKIELEQIAARAPPEDHAAASRLAEQGTPAAPTAGNYHNAKMGRERKSKSTSPMPTVPPTAADVPPPPPAPPAPTTPIAAADSTGARKNCKKRTPTKTKAVQYGVGFSFVQRRSTGIHDEKQMVFVRKCSLVQEARKLFFLTTLKNASYQKAQ